jgi:hypothetical protein
LTLFKKIIILLIILFADYASVTHIHVNPIEWSSFLPKSPAIHDKEVVLDGHKQYLFCSIPSVNTPKEWKKQQLIDRYVPLENYSNTYLLIFDISNLNTVIEKTKEYPRSGTSIVGNILFKNFFQELGFYTLVIFPFVLMILLLFIPLRLWINIVMEMGLYLLALSIVLNFGFFEINSASLLALIFLVIYALTLFNYIYAEGMNPRRLFFGIQISVAATMLSAVFLVTSYFGLIHSFGVMMMVGLGILHLYMNVRIYLMKYFPYKPYRNPLILRLSHTLWKISKKYLTVGVPVVFLASVAISYHPLNIDLNIVNLLPHSSVELERIEHFEEKRLPTLPFVISVRAKNSNFSDEKIMQELIGFQRELEPIIPGKIVASASNAFEEFSNLASDKKNPNLLAQFLLAESFSEHPFALWSADRAQSDIIVSIALTSTTNTMRTMLSHIKEISEHYPDFTITVSGKISDFDYFINIFVEEFLIGLIATLIATALFFWYYCRNMMSVSIIVYSALFSLGILGIFHILFNKPITILTLLNVILYAGLIADSLIQLFVCYKREGESCERSVLQPIFISNFSILICLGGMFFVGGMMSAFAFELGILLSANLVFILLIVPALHRRYLTTCSE